MNRCTAALAAILALGVASPALSASPAAEAAVKALAQIGADSSKLQQYCKIINDMDAAGEDEAKYEALEKQLADLLRSFGPQFEQVLTFAENVDYETPDGQALEAAFDNLDEKCEN